MVKGEMVNQKFIVVEISKIKVNPAQPRQLFAKEELEELALSIKSVGLIQPPVVRKKGNDYELISGERRLRAAKIAGLDEISVIVNSAVSSSSAEAALVENIQRVDLNPVEIAKALKRLLNEFGYSQDELALRVGKPRSTVANYLRLLSLPQAVLESLRGERISMGHAKVILSLSDVEKQQVLHKLIEKNELTVRETELEGKKLDKQPLKKLARILPQKDCFLHELEEKMQERLGTKVVIQGKGPKGKIEIHYYNLDDLDRVVEVIGNV